MNWAERNIFIFSWLEIYLFWSDGEMLNTNLTYWYLLYLLLTIFPGWNKKWSVKCTICTKLFKRNLCVFTVYILLLTPHNRNLINALINYQCNGYTVVLKPIMAYWIFRFGELARNWRSEEVSETAKSRCSLHELCKSNMCLWSKVILIVLIVRIMCECVTLFIRITKDRRSPHVF